jgi:hypothetical protein
MPAVIIFGSVGILAAGVRNALLPNRALILPALTPELPFACDSL